MTGRSPASWLGRLLRSRRSDPALSVWNQLESDFALAITSGAFGDGEVLPQRFAARKVGENTSPPLAWPTPPTGTRHLVLIIEDLDIPFKRPLIHTVAILDPATQSLAEGALAPGSPGVHFVKGMLAAGYNGPRPIVGHGAHRYQFMLFAVAGDIDTTTPASVIASAEGHVIARGRIGATYER